MRCPFCSNDDTVVKDTRPSEDSSSVRRRRLCPECLLRFTTIERIYLRELLVKKKDGRIENFDRDKLIRSLNLALHKRPITGERVERVISAMVRQFETSGDSEISSRMIGESIMTALHELDIIAYVRFASIYEDFHKTQDFEKLINNLKNKNK